MPFEMSLGILAGVILALSLSRDRGPSGVLYNPPERPMIKIPEELAEDLRDGALEAWVAAHIDAYLKLQREELERKIFGEGLRQPRTDEHMHRDGYAKM